MKQRTSSQSSSRSRASMSTRRTRSTLPATTRRPKAPGAKRKSASSRRSQARTQSNASGPSSGSAATINHEEIRQWVEAHGGQPTIVKRTSNSDQGGGILRIDFPGFSGGQSLQKVSWNQWFKIFDQRRLAFLHQKSKGKQGRFNKLVRRGK